MSIDRKPIFNYNCSSLVRQVSPAQFPGWRQFIDKPINISDLQGHIPMPNTNILPLITISDQGPFY